MSQETEDIQDKTLNLGDFIKAIKRGKFYVLAFGLFTGLLGLYTALTTPNEFTSAGQILPELQSKGGGSGLGRFASLAGIAGINLDNLGSTEAVRPDLYPNILQSTPFKLHILGQKVTVAKLNKDISLYDYLVYEEKAEFSLLSKIFGAKEALVSQPKDYGFAVKLTPQQENLLKIVALRITASMDKRTGIITIQAKMRDAVVAAQIAQKTMDYLTSYVINYRISKTAKDVEFLNERLKEAKIRKEKAEINYFTYTDQNRNPFMQSSMITQRKLEAEYSIAKSLYDELVRQLEQSRVKLSDETPIFKTLEPPRVPIKKSEPARAVLVLGFGIVGLILGLLFVINKYIGIIELFKSLTAV
jgi:uncharacterized protein involved in exopolysaccharide biosynthesis